MSPTSSPSAAPLRLIYMGTPDFAVPALKALAADPSFEIVAVYTQPPRHASRGMKLKLSAVHQAAQTLGLAVLHPVNFKEAVDREAFAAHEADVAVVAAYGLILPQAILDAPRLGCVNIHASLLPRWRGAAPIQRAILAADSESGVTIMQMVRGLDAGAMLSKARVPITDQTTASSLHDSLAQAGAALIGPTLRGLASDRLTPEPQDERLVTYAAKLTREDGIIDWRQSAKRIHAQVRALVPWPGCQFAVGGERIKLLAVEPAEGTGAPGELLSADGIVACGAGSVRLTSVQRAGKAAVDGAAFLRGFPWTPGTCADLLPLP